MTTMRQRMMEDLQIRNYAPATVRAYIRGVANFAKHFGKSPDQLGAEQIREYQLFLIKEKGVALPTYIQIISGLRFLYTNTLHCQVPIERILFPRSEKKRVMRILVMIRKNWGGNRTEKGARTQAVLTSILCTAKQQDKDLFALIVDLLRSAEPKLLDILPPKTDLQPPASPAVEPQIQPSPETTAHIPLWLPVDGWIASPLTPLVSHSQSP